MENIVKAQSFDPSHEADLGKAVSDIKQWVGTNVSPVAKKYYDKFMEHAKPAIDKSKQVLNKPFENVTNPQSKDKEGYGLYRTMVNNSNKYAEFGNISGKLLNDFYESHKSLQAEFQRIRIINSELSKYQANGEFHMNNDSVELMDKFTQSFNDIESIIKNIHKVSEDLFNATNKYHVEGVNPNQIQHIKGI